jgi:hypothetical protein
VFLLLIIPILISGFYVCNHNLYYFYRLHRYEGQYLYLKSALLGFTCLVTASFTALFLNGILPDKIWVIPLDVIAYIDSLITAAIKDPKISTIQLSWIILLSILTQLTGWLWVQVSHLHIKLREKDVEKSKIMLMSSILRDSPLDNILLESYIDETPLMLTLNDRKVYVGIVSSLGEPNESEGMDQEIAIIPIMSGYRNKENFSVTFNTDYQIIDKDLNIVLRQEIINSATEFDFDTYNKFLQSRKNKLADRSISIPPDSKYLFWKS